jgi:RNA polymerase sigma-70 factor, ECF subfamily
VTTGGGNGGGESHVSDQDLLAAHVAGDATAFDQLVRRHRDRLWAVAIRTLGDREEAADAVQEAFISALRGAARFRGESEVTTWLHRIVVNACLDRIRRRKARPAVPLDGREVRSWRDDYAATLTRLDLRAALDTLPDPQRVAIVLVDIEDVPVAEAARLLGVAEGTIKSRCARGRTALAAAMRTGYGPDQAPRAGDSGQSRPAGNLGGSPGVTARNEATGLSGLSGLSGSAEPPGAEPTERAGQGW